MNAAATFPLSRPCARELRGLERLDCLRLALAEGRVPSGAGRLVRILAGSAFAAFADASADVVVSAGALARPEAVAELARILRPGGTLAFAEPALAPAGSALRGWQRALDLVGAFGVKDRPRDVWNDLRAAGFDDLAFDHVTLPARAGLPMPHIVGTARRGAIVVPDRRVEPIAWRSSLPAQSFFG